MPLQQDMLKAPSKLRAASKNSQGTILGKDTPADEPKLGRWVADTLTSMLSQCTGMHVPLQQDML